MSAVIRRSLLLALTAICVMVGAADGLAQTPRLRAIRRAAIMDAPRVDGFVLGTVTPGTELEVIAQRGTWLEVRTPTGFARPIGWIQTSAIEMLTKLPAPPAPPKGQRMIRGFAMAGPTVFSAKESFDTILGSSSGLMYGGGGQYVLTNGAFVLAGYERYRKTGTRILLSQTQYATLPVSDQVTITPIHITVGYRDYKHKSYAPYLGVGGGWHQLQETSNGVTEKHGHASGHIMFGVEKPLAPGLAVAGEMQWSSAPKILGTTGVSAAVGEDDLGGVAFRVKFIVGR